MGTIVEYFKNIPTLHRAIIIVGGISFFLILEGAHPLFLFKYKKWKHAIPNFFFTITRILINASLAFLLLSVSDWVVYNKFGFIYFFDKLPLIIEVLIAILLLDFFGAFLAHYVEHQFNPLWMIHLAHHSDHKADTTSVNRHHPLESLIRLSFTLLAIVIVGAPMAYVLLYQSLSVISTQFNHANIKLLKN